jgi:hypothetical protein
MRDVSPETPSETPPGTPSDTQPTTSLARRDNDPYPEREEVYVFPQSSFIKLDSFTPTVAVQGTVRPSNAPVQANLDPEFDENIIALDKVAELGLKYELFDDMAVNIWIRDAGGNDERPLGQVRFQWQPTAAARGNSFTVHCWVYAHNIHGSIFFGKPFAQKLRDSQPN